MTALLPWEDARRRVLDGVSPLPPRERPLEECLGLALARPVEAPEPLPAFDHSAMDGFAVRAADTGGADRDHPARLRLGERLPAGTVPTRRIAAGEASAIMTGAPLPPGADAVVPVEATNAWDAASGRMNPAFAAEEVEIHAPVAPGQHVRRRGESVAPGERVLEAGQVLRAPQIGLLSSLGCMLVNVHPLPRVGVLSTGDELVPASDRPGPGQIRDANRPSLLAAIADYGFSPIDLGHSPDREEALRATLEAGVRSCDFLLTIGGVSVGDHDLTWRVLTRLGEVEAYKVAVKPGKPQAFGRVGGTPVFGLPGNPVSSLVVFDAFVLPSLKKMAGRRDLFWPTFPARLREPLSRTPGRAEFLRVRLTVEDNEWIARPTGSQGSGRLTSMTSANGYAILPAETGTLDAGAIVPCQLWERAG